MMSIIKCFSILVASGNGQRCNDLRDSLRKELYEVDPETEKFKIAIWKYGKKSEPDAYVRISKNIAVAIKSLFHDIDDHYFSIDNPVRKRVSK